jgi:hypothetical protein
VDLQGDLIPKKEQKFVYVPGSNEVGIVVHTPLTAEQLKNIMPVRTLKFTYFYSLFLRRCHKILLQNVSTHSRFIPC